MPIVFDGATRVATLTPGTVTLDVRDLYSRWKDFALSQPQWLPLPDPDLVAVGGLSIDPVQGTQLPLYLQLINGWRVRPPDGVRLSVVNGVLLAAGGANPFLTASNTTVVLSQPLQAIAVSTSGGGGGTTDIATLVAAIRADLVELSRLDVAVSTRATPADVGGGGGTAPTAPQVAAAVRSELAPELASVRVAEDLLRNAQTVDLVDGKQRVRNDTGAAVAYEADLDIDAQGRIVGRTRLDPP